MDKLFTALKLLSFSMVLLSCGSNSGTSASCGADSCGICPADQSGVKICSFVSTPTASESVTLKNYSSTTENLNNWSLWDLNAWGNGSGQKTFGASDTIAAGGTAVYSSLPFVINDSGETIYLKNNSGTLVDQRSN